MKIYWESPQYTNVWLKIIEEVFTKYFKNMFFKYTYLCMKKYKNFIPENWSLLKNTNIIFFCNY